MQVILDGRTGLFPLHTMVMDCIKSLWPEKAERALAVMRGGQALELTARLEGDCHLSLLTYEEEEGRRIYERSLRFVLLLAVDRLFPGQRVRIANSIGYGVLVKLPGLYVTRAQIARIQEEMHRIAEQDLPFEKKVWALEDAAAYFQRQGQEDKVRLLRYRPYAHFTMYRCGGMWEYFYGAMVPSTGYVKVFALRQQAPGLVLQMAAPERPEVPAPYIPRPKHLSVFDQSQKWCEILGAVNAADIGEMMDAGRMRQFIRVNEALHDKSIAAIADEIVGRRARAVMIAGPSSSGKTTFANRLAIHLRVLGQRPVLLSLDDFYRDRDEILPGPDGKKDLEGIDTLDLPLLNQCLEELLAGKEAGMPSFNFQTGRREEKRAPMRLTQDQPMLIEGIHGLNPAITGELPADAMYRIYVSALTCINLDDHNRIRTTDVRLLRRIVRDHQFRGTSPDATLEMWPSVRRGEDKWIFPYQEDADKMFNTALHYELPVLKYMAYDMLKAIPPEDPNYLTSRRLLKTLHYFPAMDPAALEEIPPLSILREFIGGCTFYTHE